MLLHLKPAPRGPLSATILPWPRSIVPPRRQPDLPLAAFFGHREGFPANIVPLALHRPALHPVDPSPAA